MGELVELFPRRKGRPERAEDGMDLGMEAQARIAEAMRAADRLWHWQQLHDREWTSMGDCMAIGEHLQVAETLAHKVTGDIRKGARDALREGLA